MKYQKCRTILGMSLSKGALHVDRFRQTVRQSMVIWYGHVKRREDD